MKERNNTPSPLALVLVAIGLPVDQLRGQAVGLTKYTRHTSTFVKHCSCIGYAS